MDLFEVKDLFTNMYPDKNITLEFDEKCRRVLELMFTDGLPNPFHHIENNKVKVTVEGNNPIYVNILPHREVCTWEYIQHFISQKSLATWEAPVKK